MTPVTGSLILLILFCAGTLADDNDEPSISIPEKPGKCPRAPLEMYNPRRPNICTLDEDCEGNQKCCLDGCSRRCMDPMEGSIPSSGKEKPGVCPVESDFPECEGDLITSSEGCTVDLDCEGRMKCCVHRFGPRCVLPLEDKRNPCPSFDVSSCSASHPASPNECHKDEQCPKAERCCCSDCVRKCIRTVEEKPGQCPVARSECPTHVPVQCEEDRDCPGKKKCCNGCGKKCMDPSREKPGRCPPTPLVMCDPRPPPDICKVDKDCHLNQKCCSDGCRRQCLDPMEDEKPGTCPSSMFCEEPKESGSCTEDSECPGEQKCCRIQCKTVCIIPV